MNDHDQYIDATQQTIHNLKTIARTQRVQELSSLSLPEIDELVNRIAKIAPAGNVPGVILNGLLRLPDRIPPANMVRRDIHLLFKGVEQTLIDKAIYGTFFAGPAAVLGAYQNLLRLAGKDPDMSFPEGTWQFYVDYALRDDTARHTCETHGFDSTLNQHGLTLSLVDRVTAWAMAAAYCLHQYYDLLENEWRERVSISVLQELTAAREDAESFTKMYRLWDGKRPYHRGSDVKPGEDYPAYRRRKFDGFMAAALTGLPRQIVQEWKRHIQEAEANDLLAYQQQMSIRSYLDASIYGELRKPVSLKSAHIGIIHRGRYYLLPACLPNSTTPVDVGTMRTHVTTFMAHPADTPPARLHKLAYVKRSALVDIREQLSEGLNNELDGLRLAPIWLNTDIRSRNLPLASIRQGERGVGDQPLTIFDTGETFVFDLSHIYFDGVWGVALAEILTNEALAWAVHLAQMPTPQPGHKRPYSPQLHVRPEDQKMFETAPQVAMEASAETTSVDMPAILTLRELFKQRNDFLQVTVNDLLLLYRAIHAVIYRPSPELLVQLEYLQQDEDGEARSAAELALTAILKTGRTKNPAILIPVDGSKRNPRDRVFPMTFEVPLDDLDLLNQHQKSLAALGAYERATRNRDHAYAQFAKMQKEYLTTLAGLGTVLNRSKDAAVAGDSMSIGTIRLLANLPVQLQRMLDRIPGQFDVLNDMLKGREVFSNVGKVAPTSSLTRFMTAKDDNEKKELAWGLLTDAEGILHITLRDFRPHVPLLTAVGRPDLAISITTDLLESYAAGLNQYVRDVYRIAAASYKKRRWFARV
ncbi:MAG: hypothetical protein GY796_21585 [Chloroflexi bacterium]|nr:hypothetical protein [Chloroflexota bacterium]